MRIKLVSFNGYQYKGDPYEVDPYVGLPMCIIRIGDY